MKLFTIRTQILDVAKRWSDQYANWPHDFDGEKAGIGRKLKRLKKSTASAEDVAAIIGNDSWAREEECSECEQKAGVLVELGWDSEYDCPKVKVCRTCIQKAATLIKNATPEST